MLLQKTFPQRNFSIKDEQLVETCREIEADFIDGDIGDYIYKEQCADQLAAPDSRSPEVGNSVQFV